VCKYLLFRVICKRFRVKSQPRSDYLFWQHVASSNVIFKKKSFWNSMRYIWGRTIRYSAYSTKYIQREEGIFQIHSIYQVCSQWDGFTSGDRGETRFDTGEKMLLGNIEVRVYCICGRTINIGIVKKKHVTGSYSPWCVFTRRQFHQAAAGDTILNKNLPSCKGDAR